MLRFRFPSCDVDGYAVVLVELYNFNFLREEAVCGIFLEDYVNVAFTVQPTVLQLAHKLG